MIQTSVPPPCPLRLCGECPFRSPSSDIGSGGNKIASLPIKEVVSNLKHLNGGGARNWPNNSSASLRQTRLLENEQREKVKEVMNNRVIEVRTGRRGRDGILQLELYTRQLLAIKLKGYAERTTTPLLNRDQAVALRAALDELIPELEPETTEEEQPRMEVLETRREAA